MSDAKTEPRSWRVPLQILEYFEMPRNPEFVDVIEQSAFDALQSELANLKTANERLECRLHEEMAYTAELDVTNGGLKFQIADLKAENEKLKRLGAVK